MFNQNSGAILKTSAVSVQYLHTCCGPLDQLTYPSLINAIALASAYGVIFNFIRKIKLRISSKRNKAIIYGWKIKSRQRRHGIPLNFVPKIPTLVKQPPIMTVRPSKDAALGQQHSYSLNPPQPAGCKVTWKINNKDVTVGTEVGGLRVNGLNGTLTVTAIGEVKDTIVSAEVVCGGQEMPTESFKHSLSITPIATKKKSWLRLLFDAIRAVFSRHR
jgi:hypothetical protein